MMFCSSRAVDECIRIAILASGVNFSALRAISSIRVLFASLLEQMQNLFDFHDNASKSTVPFLCCVRNLQFTVAGCPGAWETALFASTRPRGEHAGS